MKKEELKNMVYLIYGSDPFIVDWNIKGIVNKIEYPDFELLKSEEFTEDTLNFLRQYPLMGKYRGVLLEIAKLGILKDNKLFNSYLKKPAKHSELIIKADSVDERLTIFKSLKSENCKVIKCDKLGYDKLKASILAHIKKNDASITSDALELFINRVNYLDIDTVNMYELINKLNVLIQYDSKITVDTVKAVVTENVKTNAFSILDKIIKGNMSEVYTQIDAILANKDSSEIGLLSLIQREFRLSYKAALLKADAKSMGVYFPPKKMSTETAREALELLDKAILDEKSSSVDSRVLLNVTLEKLYYLLNKDKVEEVAACE